ncbi:MAG: hypothetical protein ACUVUC_08445 [Thermoguttaceae bacterium]
MRGVVVVFGVLAAASALAAQPATKLPEGPGLAARYPGDAGIAQAPEVLFAEDFEQGDLAAILQRWTDAKNPRQEAFRLVEDVPAGSLGRHALQMTARPAQDTGGYLYKRLPRGVDRAFARFYVKFPEPAGYIHHFVHVGGYRPATNWPQGGAGQRPRGDERFTVGIEPFGENGRVPPPGNWNFYTYWHEMKRSADGRYWGNALRPIRPQPAPPGRWQCVELMIQLNSTPDRWDGDLALWLDGKLVAHFYPGAPRGPWTGLGFQLLEKGGTPFEGLHWRTTPELKINFFWLLHYVTPEALRRNQVADLRAENRVLFDHIVVATDYIGPIQPKQER